MLQVFNHNLQRPEAFFSFRYGEPPWSWMWCGGNQSNVHVNHLHYFTEIRTSQIMQNNINIECYLISILTQLQQASLSPPFLILRVHTHNFVNFGEV